MPRSLFPKGLIAIEVNEKTYLAEYMGRQMGFECCLCGKGGNCYTFNIFDSYEDYLNGNYETWGYGREHISHIKLVKNYGEGSKKINVEDE